MFRALASRIPKSICTVKSESPVLNVACKRNLSSDSEFEEKPLSNLVNIDTAKCLNRVTLLGRATGPAQTFTVSDNEFASFTLATNEIRRNRANELVKRSEFHRVQVFIPRMVNKTKQVVQKGSRILVEGKINYNTRKGESGTLHFTNIVAENIVFITGNRETQNEHEEIDDEVESGVKN